MSSTVAKQQRLYETWEGNNIFFCSGRLIAGPDWTNAIKTALAVLLPSILFMFTVAIDMRQSTGMWPFIIVPCCIICTLVLLALTSLSDPGIIPRSTSYSSADRSNVPKQMKEILIEGQTVRLKWCETCIFFRPPRCSHCSVCSNCVENWDHHCPWLGNCIGKRNYRSFFLFLLMALFSTTIVFFLSCWHLLDHFNDLRNGNLSSLILSLYTFVMFWFVFGLFCFHFYLLCTGTTTNEKLKQTFPEGSPFSRGPFRNFASLFCTMPTKSNFRLRRKIDSDVALNASSLNDIAPSFRAQNGDDMNRLPPISLDATLDEDYVNNFESDSELIYSRADVEAQTNITNEIDSLSKCSWSGDENSMSKSSFNRQFWLTHTQPSRKTISKSNTE